MPTRQEKIREGISELIRLAILNQDSPLRPTEEVLAYLHSAGCVLKGKRDPKYIELFKVEPLIEQ